MCLFGYETFVGSFQEILVFFIIQNEHTCRLRVFKLSVLFSSALEAIFFCWSNSNDFSLFSIRLSACLQFDVDTLYLYSFSFSFVAFPRHNYDNNNDNNCRSCGNRSWNFDFMYSSAFLTICIHELDYIPMIYENGKETSDFWPAWRWGEGNMDLWTLSIVISDYCRDRRWHMYDIIDYRRCATH